MNLMLDLKPPVRPRSRVARAALTLALFALTATAFAAVALRAGAVEPFAGFVAALAGLGLAAFAALVGVIGAVIVWRTGARGGVRALFAIAIAAALLAGPAYVAGRAFQKPRLPDVSTDLADPPAFTRARLDRKPGDAAPPGAIAHAQAEAQKAAYPEIAPLRLAVSPEEAAGLVIGLIEQRGWRLLGPTSYPRGGPPRTSFEATARTPVLGLSDDVAIRIRPDGENGSRVDMRSAARIGAADFGAAAERVRSFLADLAAAAAP
ncbi:DUF1499 domain-containing protein [Methylopila turkensis]|uniref:DUF1499 domain-containing protein n=1 Tax=Methylopila turkensis TaxID=1437816 RepID=A0A9W6JL13_9HYPH|nr:DUF1499 domain-containing protein [Methylopila turkensis]GLK78351.1 hypothetical protein GCM10008174_00920 [Methylopila turkensis]